ncbi:MAG: hypothetical protein AAF485_15040 [Chloroflexota bacterium]
MSDSDLTLHPLPIRLTGSHHPLHKTHTHQPIIGVGEMERQRVGWLACSAGSNCFRGI